MNQCQKGALKAALDAMTLRLRELGTFDVNIVSLENSTRACSETK